jgi:hypothetical protein
MKFALSSDSLKLAHLEKCCSVVKSVMLNCYSVRLEINSFHEFQDQACVFVGLGNM